MGHIDRRTLRKKGVKYKKKEKNLEALKTFIKKIDKDGEHDRLGRSDS